MSTSTTKIPNLPSRSDLAALFSSHARSEAPSSCATSRSNRRLFTLSFHCALLSYTLALACRPGMTLNSPTAVARTYAMTCERKKKF
eukprot:5268339-Amphidinium_carterae.1